MKYVTTVHKPTTVTHSIKCSLTADRSLEHLVVAKVDSIEIYELAPEGLKLVCEAETWGRITSLHALDVKGRSKPHFLVTTDHPDPFLLVYGLAASPEATAQCELIMSESLYEQDARGVEYFNGAVTDGERTVAISTYVGKLKILQFDPDDESPLSVDISIPEMNILSMCFTRGSQKPVISVLYRNHEGNVALTTHEIDMNESSVSTPPPSSTLKSTSIDPLSSVLIPIPPYDTSPWNRDGGILVLGGQQLSFHRYPQPKRAKGKSAASLDREEMTVVEVEWPYSEILTWAKVDEARFLLGDVFGRIALLAFSLQDPQMRVHLLGDASPPQSLTPLTSQYIYLGSHYGDSQILRIVSDKSSIAGSHLEVVETYKNISPIMDAVVADVEMSGQPQIVTCSGGKSTGSLRVIRSGASFEESVVIRSLPNVVGVWPLRREFYDKDDVLLVVATTNLTRVYNLPSESGSDLEPNSDVDFSQSRTLVASNVIKRTVSAAGKSVYQNSTYVVQVTTEEVVLTNTATFNIEARWITPLRQTIVAADVNPCQICLGLSGGRLVFLCLEDDRFIELSGIDFPNSQQQSTQISSISVRPEDSTKMTSKYAVVGFWETREVAIYGLPSWVLLSGPFKLQGFPRVVHVQGFGSASSRRSYVFVGQADGVVVVLPFIKGKVVGERKTVSLGDSPISICSCGTSDDWNVLVTGHRSVIFYEEKDVLRHSPVALKGITTAAAIRPPNLILSLVLANPTGLVIGQTQDLHTHDIRSVSMGLNNPVRIAYIPESKIFGVGCIRIEPRRLSEPERVSSTFRLINGETFQTMNILELDLNEEVTSVDSVTLVCNRVSSPYFCVGSMFYAPDEKEPSKGRVRLITGVPVKDAGGSLILHASSDVYGCVYAATSVRGQLVVAVNTGVRLYSLEYSDPVNSESADSLRLVKIAEWNHNYFLTSLTSHGDNLIVGDAISSLAVIRISDSKFQTVTREHSPLWPLCIEVLDGNTITGANVNNNLFSFKIQASSNNKDTIERDGEYHFNDTVNKILNASPNPLRDNPSAPVVKQVQYLFASSGRISIVLGLDDYASLHLSALQRNMEAVITHPAGINHATWRTPVGSRGRSDALGSSYGFLDGDFLNKFVTLSVHSLEVRRILAGVTDAEKLIMSYPQLRALLEAIHHAC